MNETLKSILDNYTCGLLSTNNIQVFKKNLSNETIKFLRKLIVDLTFNSSTFKKSDLINMPFSEANLRWCEG